MKSLQLSADEVIRFAAQSGEARIKRAAMLMTYGWNRSHEARSTDLRLEGFIQFVDTPREFTFDQLEAFREDFQAWTIGNGLRELVTALEGLLDFLHLVLIETERHLNRQHPRETRSKRTSFEKIGLASKLLRMKKQFGIDTRLSKYYDTITAVRNCLTHRSGIVSEKDCDSNGVLKLAWLGFDTSITEPNGQEHQITHETLGPINTSEFEGEGNAKLNIEWINREIEFHIGDQIKMSPRQLEEICHMGTLTCVRLRQHTTNWLLEQGVNVNGGVPVPEPTVEIYLEEISS